MSGSGRGTYSVEPFFLCGARRLMASIIVDAFVHQQANSSLSGQSRQRSRKQRYEGEAGNMRHMQHFIWRQPLTVGEI